MSNRTAYFYDPDVGNFHYGEWSCTADIRWCVWSVHSLGMFNIFCDSSRCHSTYFTNEPLCGVYNGAFFPNVDKSSRLSFKYRSFPA